MELNNKLFSKTLSPFKQSPCASGSFVPIQIFFSVEFVLCIESYPLVVIGALPEGLLQLGRQRGGELLQRDRAAAVDVAQPPQLQQLSFGQPQPKRLADEDGELTRVDQPIAVSVKLSEGLDAVIGRQVVLGEEPPRERLQLHELPTVPNQARELWHLT